MDLVRPWALRNGYREKGHGLFYRPLVGVHGEVLYRNTRNHKEYRVPVDEHGDVHPVEELTELQPYIFYDVTVYRDLEGNAKCLCFHTQEWAPE